MMMPAMMVAEKSALKGLLGAFHPGIVHFPIALLAVAALFETWQILRKKKEPAGGTAAMAHLAAASAILASLFGFILADYGGSEGSLIDTHKWLGIAATVVAVAAALCALKAKSSPGSLLGLRATLILGTGLVMATGYFGGEMVFEKDHIVKHVRKLFGTEPAKTEETSTPDRTVKTEPAPEKPPLLTVSSRPATSADKVDFAKDIAPMIQAACFKCHGGEKVKGKFKLNTKKDAFEGGESGKAILPGKPALSKFYTSLTDPDEDILMPPPKEKVRPSKEQIEKVRQWIEQGAEWPDGVEFKK